MKMISDCRDFYGRSKLLGGVAIANAVTLLRTSIISHEWNAPPACLNGFYEQRES